MEPTQNSQTETTSSETGRSILIKIGLLIGVPAAIFAALEVLLAG